MTRTAFPHTVVFDLRPLQCGYAGRGIGRYTRELFRALQMKLASPSAAYRLQTLGFRGGDPIPGAPASLLAPRWERVWLWDQCALPFHLWRTQAALFHSPAALGPLKEVNFPIPYTSRSVLTVHDWHLEADDASPVERFYRQTRRWRIQKWALPRAARVVVDSVCVAEETAHRARVARENCRVLLPGADHLDTVVETLPVERDFVLSIGDGPHKGLDTGFQSMRLAREKGLNRSWVILGNPDRVRENLGFQAIPPWVRIVPHATDAELKGFYRSALCLLFPSRREGFGFPLLEAMRLGCPVLTNDVEPMRSVAASPASLISPGDVGAFAEALIRLNNGKTFRGQLEADGRERAREFRWDRTAESVISVWDELLDVSRRK